MVSRLLLSAGARTLLNATAQKHPYTKSSTNGNPKATSSSPQMLAYGEIICSSKFPSGYIITLSKAKGEKLNHYRIRDEVSTEEKLRIYTQCRKGAIVLRAMGVYASDCGPRNVLYCPKTKDVLMVDFELAEVTETGKQ